MVKRRRLYFDCEVSPNIGFFWQPGHKISINYDNIIKERAIICICYKWEGEKKIHSLTWNKGDDKKMLQAFIKVANQASELVGHNSDRFDITWVRTRCLFHSIPVMPNYTSIDTLKAARSKFRFNSNRLDYIGKFLGVGQKIHTGFDLWKTIVLDNNTKAMNKMVKYCKQDVKLLEDIFGKLNNYLPPKTHYGERGNCPECGSDNLINGKARISATGIKRMQYQCGDCGKYSTKSDKVRNK